MVRSSNTDALRDLPELCKSHKHSRFSEGAGHRLSGVQPDPEAPRGPCVSPRGSHPAGTLGSSRTRRCVLRFSRAASAQAPVMSINACAPTPAHGSRRDGSSRTLRPAAHGMAAKPSATASTSPMAGRRAWPGSGGAAARSRLRSPVEGIDGHGLHAGSRCPCMKVRGTLDSCGCRAVPMSGFRTERMVAGQGCRSIRRR